MKQKLLLIIEAMSGGAGRHVQDLISHLSQEKFEIFVIYSNGKLQVQVSHPDKPVSACCN